MDRVLLYFAVLFVIGSAAACVAQEGAKATATPKNRAWTVLCAGVSECNMDKRSKAV
jgi:invasion protein IalB